MIEIYKNIFFRIGQLLNKDRSKITVKRILILLFSISLLLITYLLSLPYFVEEVSYKIGDQAIEDIKVFRDISYEIEDKTELKRKNAYKNYPLVFDRNEKIFIDLLKRNKENNIEKEFSLFVEIANENLDFEKAYQILIQKIPYLRRTSRFTKEDVKECFLPQNKKILVKWATSYARKIYNNFGIAKKINFSVKKLNQVKAQVRTINSEEEIADKIWKSYQIISKKNIFYKDNLKKLSNLGDETFQNLISIGAKKVIIQRILLAFYRHPYVEYNDKETEFRKKAKVKMILPVVKTLRKGKILLKRGEIIDGDTLKEINRLNQFRKSVNVKYIIGIFIIQLIFSLGVGFFIFYFSEFRVKDLSSNFILTSLIWTIILYSFFISNIDLIQNGTLPLALLVPIGYFGTMSRLLFGARMTVPIGLYISLFIYFLSGFDTSSFIISIVSVMAGIYAAESMSARTKFIKGALITGFAIAVAVISMDLILNHEIKFFQTKMIVAFLNGLIGIFLTTGILPIYETIFNIPSKFRLMELADFNHPLLKQLATTAPATYTHSIMVANLSERAVLAIKGDTLLTKVGCFFHDIGKTAKPEFFAENKHLQLTREKETKLGPLKSAKIIISHVVEGIELARAANLPEKVIAFIPEHHGTSSIQYFYHKALENYNASDSENKREPKKENYQYPGPRPQSKETAIVMIADSLEAASRTLEDSSEEALKSLIEVVIQNKLHEEQFDESPLTFEDIKLVKDAFLDVLLGSYHLRPKYPTIEETEQLEETENNKKEQEKPKQTKPISKTTKKKTTKK